MGWKEDFDKEIQAAMEELDKIALDPTRRAEYEAKDQYLRDKIAFTMGEIEDARENGREEGRQAGIKEGRKVGIKEGREEGKKEGRKEGRKEGKEIMIKETALRLKYKNYTIKQISELLEIDEEKVKHIIDKNRSEIKA